MVDRRTTDGRTPEDIPEPYCPGKLINEYDRHSVTMMKQKL